MSLWDLRGISMTNMVTFYSLLQGISACRAENRPSSQWQHLPFKVDVPKAHALMEVDLLQLHAGAMHVELRRTRTCTCFRVRLHMLYVARCWLPCKAPEEIGNAHGSASRIVTRVACFRSDIRSFTNVFPTCSDIFSPGKTEARLGWDVQESFQNHDVR